MSDAVITTWSLLAFALIVFLILVVRFPDLVRNLAQLRIGGLVAMTFHQRSIEDKEHRKPSRRESRRQLSLLTPIQMRARRWILWPFNFRFRQRAILERDQRKPSRRERILWVDDKPLGNLYEIMALKEVGWDVISATTNARAAEALKGDGFALVISDIDRDPACEPEKAGRELPEALAAVSSHVPPIIYYVGTVTEPQVHGKYPVTNRPSELFRLIADCIRQPEPGRA